MADPTPANRSHPPPIPLPPLPEPGSFAAPLPTSLTSFVGREREVEQVTALLCRGDARLVTLTGPVGRLLAAQQPGGMAVSLVRFTDGARMHWHVHPGEQVLYILEGEGRVGTGSEEIRVGPGDVVHAAPGERHWHGAVPGKSMAHLSVTTVGSPEWFEVPE